MRTCRADVHPNVRFNPLIWAQQISGPNPVKPAVQVSGNAATVRFQFATKPMVAAAAKAGFLSCLLPHHVDAGATGKVVLKVSPCWKFISKLYTCNAQGCQRADAGASRCRPVHHRMEPVTMASHRILAAQLLQFYLSPSCCLCKHTPISMGVPNLCAQGP